MLEIIFCIILMPLAIACGLLAVVLVAGLVGGFIKSFKRNNK